MSTPTPILNLYRVTLKGFGGYCTSTDHKVNYVVAADPTSAYQRVRSELDDKNYGFMSERELDKIELLASTPFYTDVGTRLYLPDSQGSTP